MKSISLFLNCENFLRARCYRRRVSVSGIRSCSTRVCRRLRGQSGSGARSSNYERSFVGFWRSGWDAEVQDAQEARHQTATLKGCLAGASASAGALFVVACGMAESFEVGVQGDLIIVSRQQGSTQSIQSLLIRRS